MPDTITIKKRVFTLPVEPPYRDGHVCNQREADALASDWRDKLKAHIIKVTAALEKAGGEFTDADFAAEAASFSPDKRAPILKADPVAAEARRLAREAIKTQLRLRGVKPAELAAGEFERLTIDLLTERPEYRIEAAHRVHAARQEAAHLVGEKVGVQ